MVIEHCGLIANIPDEVISSLRDQHGIDAIEEVKNILETESKKTNGFKSIDISSIEIKTSFEEI